MSQRKVGEWIRRFVDCHRCRFRFRVPSSHRL